MKKILILFSLFTSLHVAAGPVGDQLTSFDNGTVANATTVNANFSALGQAIDKVLVSNVVWVAKSGGHFTSIAEALAFISSLPSGSAATAVNPYVIRIAPGAYQEPTLTVPGYTSLVGSGSKATRIYSQASPGIAPEKGATEVRLADFELTLIDENSGYGISHVAVDENMHLENINLIVTVASGAGIFFNGGGSLTLSDTSIAVNGTDAGSISGVELRGTATLEAINCTITAGGDSDSVFGVNVVGRNTSAEIDGCAVTTGGSGLVAGVYLDASAVTDYNGTPTATIRNSVLHQTGGDGDSGTVSGVMNTNVSGTSPKIYIAHTEMNTEAAGDLYSTCHHAYKWNDGGVTEVETSYCRILSP